MVLRPFGSAFLAMQTRRDLDSFAAGGNFLGQSNARGDRRISSVVDLVGIDRYPLLCGKSYAADERWVTRLLEGKGL